jgi:uncharacterized protein
MQETTVVDKTGNPAPLGLMGFGMTTILLNLHNAGIIPLDSMILSMGIFYGGLAQVIAGIMEWKKGNTFACTAFTSYGMFWLSLVALVTLPKSGLGLAGPSGYTMPAYLGMWGVFTAVLFLGTLRLSRALQIVFGSLTVLFFLLAAGDATGIAALGRIAGWEGVFCGASAVYTGLAQVLNEVNGRVMWPLGPVAKQ